MHVFTEIFKKKKHKNNFELENEKFNKLQIKKHTITCKIYLLTKTSSVLKMKSYFLTLICSIVIPCSLHTKTSYNIDDKHFLMQCQKQSCKQLGQIGASSMLISKQTTPSYFVYRILILGGNYFKFRNVYKVFIIVKIETGLVKKIAKRQYYLKSQ